jgi:hypothetical protein
MRIFIDEAGPFVVPPSAQSLFSLVLALVIPSCVEGGLFAEFSQLRDGWSSQGGEVKGSKLDESQAAQLIDLVSRYDVFVNFFATDMARNDDAIVSAYKARQADAITAGLTVGIDGREVVLYASHHGHWASWTFYSALGEMRGTFGVHLAKIAAEFKLDIEDRLASILPADAEADSGEDEHRPARRR